MDIIGLTEHMFRGIIDQEQTLIHTTITAIDLLPIAMVMVITILIIQGDHIRQVGIHLLITTVTITQDTIIIVTTTGINSSFYFYFSKTKSISKCI